MDRIIDLRKALPPEQAAHESTEGPLLARRLLDPHGIAFIIPVKDETQYRICLRYIDALQIPRGYVVERIAVFGGGSMAEVYQQAMEASKARYKIYLHVDAYLVYPELLLELLSLFRTHPRLGLVGVSGATRLPARVLLSVNNSFYCFGRHWTYRRPGGPSSLLGPANRRRLDFSGFRAFSGDYLPAVAIDGFIMATQYDIPWVHPVFGFDLYDQVQSLEFIKLGLEVGIARQENVWCVHWGPLEEFSHEQQRRRHMGFRHKAGVFRQLYPAFIGVPARKVYQLHRGGAEWLGIDLARERLGVVIVKSGGRETLLRALRALLPQCEALKESEYQVVVVDAAAGDDTDEAVRRESPNVTVIAQPDNGGLAGAFNAGLRYLGFPRYILVTHDDAEFSAGTLAPMVRYLREHPSTAGVVASLVDPDGTTVGTTCALIRGEVFFDVGLYDERFSSCLEDLDWSLRARRKGYKFVHLPGTRALYYRRGGLRQNGPAIFAERSVASLKLVYKHGGRRRAVALYWIQRMQAMLLAVRWRHDREALHQIGEAMAQMKGLYRRFREENRRPQVL